jgi:hypothetical protein
MDSSRPLFRERNQSRRNMFLAQSNKSEDFKTQKLGLEENPYAIRKTVTTVDRQKFDNEKVNAAAADRRKQY